MSFWVRMKHSVVARSVLGVRKKRWIKMEVNDSVWKEEEQLLVGPGKRMRLLFINNVLH